MSGLQVFQTVLRQFAMGSSIGSVFTSALLASDASAFDVVLHSSAPVTALIALMLGTSFYFGFGAAVTGFVLIVTED